MKYPTRTYYTETDKTLMWDRWRLSRPAYAPSSSSGILLVDVTAFTKSYDTLKIRDYLISRQYRYSGWAERALYVRLIAAMLDWIPLIPLLESYAGFYRHLSTIFGSGRF